MAAAPVAEPAPPEQPEAEAVVTAEPVGPASPSAARLGRLAQTARSKELRNARGIMFFIGAITIVANLIFFSMAASSVQSEIDKELGKLGPRFIVDNAKLEALKTQAVRTVRLINAAGVLLGALFVGCGVLVPRYPVPVTITALALYLGGNAIFAMIDPSTLGAGIIVKAIIVFALFKAVQAAIAYQKEQASAAA